MNEGAFNWLVVHSKPLSEWQAHVNLLNQGFTSFLPYKIHTRPSGRRMEGIVSGYFPRYLFVGVEPKRSIRPINSTYGVSSLVYLGDSPLTVPERVMEQLKARCSMDGLVLDDRRKPAAAWHVGQSAKITEGPFAGFIGEIARIDGSATVDVWVDLFGRKVKAMVPTLGIAA